MRMRATKRWAALWPALAVGIAWSSPVAAQPAQRGKPAIRTPTQALPRAATPTAKPGAAPAANPAGGAPTAGTQKDPNDPMAGVKQGPAEIDFQPKPGNYQVSFNLDDADLPELVKAISNITGRRFIYGGKIRAIKATVYAPEKVSAAEAYSAFLSILETNGLTVIPHGRFLKIIETPGVVQQTTQIYGTGAPVPAEDRYVTRLYRLRNVDAGEMATVLTKFKSKDGDITVYGPGNLLIITETGSNIRRMLRIVEEVDVGSAGDQLWVQPVHYGGAEDVAGKLNEILNLEKGGGGASIISDERTNSLIITATKGDYQRILELVKRMDVPQTGEGQIHVLPLQHAACDDLSGTLNDVLGGVASGGGAAAGGRGRAAAAPTTGTAEDIFEGSVKVTCDEATNSMVTTSSLRDYAQLRAVIDRLDQPRRQVFIEAVIMDLGVTRVLDLGNGYHAGSDFDVGGEQGFFYGGNNPAQSAVVGTPSNLSALALGVRGPEIDGSQNVLGTGISIPAFGVVLHALAEDGDNNVLATPHILATDNIPAEISIGQNIPLQTNVGGGQLGQLASAAGAGGAAGGLGSLLGGGLGFNAPRQDVGTRISVTPHINDSDQVRLEIAEEISTAGAPQGALGAIPINKRTATTTLIVKDQQTVIIGGLVRDELTNAETKIPLLGDLPVLGFLFRQSRTTKTKSNLLLILTPHVVRDQGDLRAIFERKMQERQEFLDRYFIFSDVGEWEPPRDFRRANGLVEDVRQQQIGVEERARIIEETRPRDIKTHEPVEPIALPSIGAKPAAVKGASAKPAPRTSTRKGANRTTTPRTPTPRPSLRSPAQRLTPGGAPNRDVDRIE